MKSINVKNIVAVGFGALLATSALVGAVNVDPNIGNIQFFGQNGEPNVQIVVGSHAAPSDAVAAANLAATIGNLAYAKKDIAVLGADGLTCTAANGGSSLSNVLATADVTLPGINSAVAYVMKSYVEDRVDYQSDSVRDMSTNFNGWYADLGNAKKITSDQTQVLSMPNDGKVTNTRNVFVQQKQNIYFGASSVYQDDQVESKDVHAVYETTFSDPLPACWETNKVYANCPDNSKLDYTHTKINFLGAQWVVTDFTLSGNDFKSISLGKETAYKPFMTIGDEVGAPNGVSVKLVDISVFGFGGEQQPKVTFKLFDENNVELTTIILQPKGDYSGYGVNLHLYDAMTGVAGTSSAEVSVFSDVIELTDGAQVPGSTTWSAELFSALNSNSEGLQKIMLYQPSSTITLEKGDSFTIIQNKEGFRITFTGLEDKPYDSLGFSLNKDMNLPLGSSTYLNSDFIMVNSGKNTAFSFVGDTINRNSVYVLAKNGNMTYANGTISNIAYMAGDVFYQNSDGTFTNTTNGVLDYHYSSSENVTLNFTSVDGILNKVFVPEITEDYSSTAHNAWSFVYDAPNRNFDDNSLLYGGNGVDAGYVSWRGSTAVGESESSMGLRYSTEIAHAGYNLQRSGNYSDATNSVTAKIGEYLLNQDGYKVLLKGVTAGANGACQLGGVESLQPSLVTANEVYDISRDSMPLVTFDGNVAPGKTIIAIGGQLVNTISADAGISLSSSDEAIVKVVGNKIIVAGWSASDTARAVDELADWIRKNKV